MRHPILCIALLAVVFTMSACGGGGSKTLVTNRTTTVGQELLDLQRALNEGAITQREYERKKRIILDPK